MINKKIIAIVGMAGSGKSEAVEYLKKTYNWPNIYFGQLTFDRMKKDGLSQTQANERLAREKIRQELGKGAYAILLVPKIKAALKQSRIITLESLYGWDEYKIIKKKFGDNFKVIAVYASPAIRFQRLKNRKIRPLKVKKEFDERDWTEIEKTDKGGPIAVADYTIVNDGSLKKLKKNIDLIIGKII